MTDKITQIQPIEPPKYPDMPTLATIEEIQGMVDKLSGRTDTLEFQLNIKIYLLANVRIVVQQMDKDIIESLEQGYDSRTILKWMMNHVDSLKGAVGLEQMTPDEFDELFKVDDNG